MSNFPHVINGNLGTKWKNRKIQKCEKQQNCRALNNLIQMESDDDQSDQCESDQ